MREREGIYVCSERREREVNVYSREREKKVVMDREEEKKGLFEKIL